MTSLDVTSQRACSAQRLLGYVETADSSLDLSRRGLLDELGCGFALLLERELRHVDLSRRILNDWRFNSVL
jgi:hypothetical protein